MAVDDALAVAEIYARVGSADMAGSCTVGERAATAATLFHQALLPGDSNRALEGSGSVPAEEGAENMASGRLLLLLGPLFCVGTAAVGIQRGD